MRKHWLSANSEALILTPENLILTPENQANISSDPKHGAIVGDAINSVTSQNKCNTLPSLKCGKCGHMGLFGVCHFKQNKGRGFSPSTCRSSGGPRTKPCRGWRGGNSKEQRDVHNVTGDTSAENRVSNDDFYVFHAWSTDEQNTM